MGAAGPAGRQVRRGAYPAGPPLHLAGALRSGSCGCRPSGLGCLRPRWRANPRTRRRGPPRRPRAPTPRRARACALGDAGLGAARGGACLSGEAGPREGGTPSPRPRGAWLPRPPGPGFRLTDAETSGGEAERLLRERRTVSDLPRSRPANTLSSFHREGDWGSERRSHLSEDTRRLDGCPARRVRAPAAPKFPASSLAALPAVSPHPLLQPFVSQPPTPRRVKGQGRWGRVWEAPSIPPPPATPARCPPTL